MDILRLFRDEIADLAKAGCRYIQLDEDLELALRSGNRTNHCGLTAAANYLSSQAS